MGDIKGECKAHGHLGAVHMSLANYTNAMKCYEEQLERAKELKVRSGCVASLSRRANTMPASSVPAWHHYSPQRCLFSPSHLSPSVLPLSLLPLPPPLPYPLSSLPPSHLLIPHPPSSSYLHPSPTTFPSAVIAAPSIRRLVSCHYFLPFFHPLASLPARY